MNIRFRKLFKKIKNGEVIDQAIISWNRHDWIQGIRDSKAVVIELRNVLFIDIWIAQLRFEWKTPVEYKVKAPQGKEKKDD